MVGGATGCVVAVLDAGAAHGAAHGLVHVRSIGGKSPSMGSFFWAGSAGMKLSGGVSTYCTAIYLLYP